jgi:hypothetical protein
MRAPSRPPFAPAVPVHHPIGSSPGRRALAKHAAIAVVCLVAFYAGVAVWGSILANALFYLVGS